MSKNLDTSADEQPDKHPGPGTPEVLRDIERLVGREPLDRVKCVNVFGDFYRCNWWAPTPARPEANESFDWATRATHYVRASRFLRVTVTNGRPTIVELDDAENGRGDGPVLLPSAPARAATAVGPRASGPFAQSPPPGEGGGST